MRRRDLLMLLGTASLGPLGAAAQQSVPVVGFLFIGDPERSGGCCLRYGARVWPSSVL